MLVTKLKMQSSPYGDSVISAQTEHLKRGKKSTKTGEKKLRQVEVAPFNSLLLLKYA